MDLDSRTNNLTSRIISAALAVHGELGPGHLESVHHEALAIALTEAGVRYRREVPFTIEFHGRVVGQGRYDLIVEEQILVDVKAVEKLHPIHVSQVVSYPAFGPYRVGLLLNLDVSMLKDGGIRRILRSCSRGSGVASGHAEI